MLKPRLLKTYGFVLVVLSILSYQKDESVKRYETISENQSSQKISLREQIQMGFNKSSLIRLQQSATDIR